MKALKSLLIAGLLGLAISAEAGATSGRIYIKVRPPKAKKFRIIHVNRPHRNIVFITGNWHWNGHRHVWKKGRYVKSRRGFVFVNGYWKQTRQGWYYKKGQWKKA